MYTGPPQLKIGSRKSKTISKGFYNPPLHEKHPRKQHQANPKLFVAVYCEFDILNLNLKLDRQKRQLKSKMCNIT